MPAKRIKKYAKNPQATQQQEELNNKMVEDSADCIEITQPLAPTYLYNKKRVNKGSKLEPGKI